MREFFYGAYCDFYLESTKPLLKNNKLEYLADQQEFVWNILRECNRLAMIMYHPFIPSITEELWQKCKMGGAGDTSILDSKYPKYEDISAFKVVFIFRNNFLLDVFKFKVLC